MDEDKISITCLAAEVSDNDMSESDAITKYTKLLHDIDKSELKDEDKKALKDKINEIISDEQNHQSILQEAYIGLTGIEPAKD